MSSPYSLFDRPRAFRGPNRIWFGAGASGRIQECLQELGIRPGRAVLVTDAVVDRLRLAADVADGLLAAGFELHRYAEIPGEPSVEVADAAAALARRISPTLVVGVGGGSVLDVAKLSAALARNPGSVLDYTQFGGKRFAEAAVPTILVPTTAGTGAETSQNAVVISGTRKASATNHPQLLATGIILDPILTYSLPPTVTAHTGLDALSHCMEGTLSTNASALTDLMAAHGTALIFGALRPAFASAGGGSPDPEARARMLLAAYMGGLALNAGMVLGHSIANTLSNRLHLPHGLSCALALPYTLAYNRAAAPDRLGALARAAGVEGHDVVAHVGRLCRDVGIPEAVRSLGLERDRLPELVDECVQQYPRPTNPRPFEREPLLSLYAAMWEGRPAHEWTH